MTATHSPKAVADQGRAAYSKTTDQLGNLGLDTAVPEGVRELAEKTVAQTREAFERSWNAFDASLTTFERTFDAAGQGAAAFNRKIVDLARRNLDASFDLATSSSRRQGPRRHGRAAIGLLAQAIRCIDGASRGSPRTVNEGDHRCGRADQGSGGTRRGWAGALSAHSGSHA